MNLSPADIATALANGGSLSKSVAETLAGQPLAWKCACGWTGYPAEMRSNALGHRTCPDCGGSGGLVSVPLAAPPPAPLVRIDATEADFMAWVIARAKEYRWLVYHTHDSRKSAAGFPDLVLARGGEIIFAELKGTKGKLTAEQRQWIDMIGLHVPCCVHCKIAVYVWRPADAEDILSVLR